METETYALMVETLVGHFGVSAQSINLDTTLAQLEIDSLSVIELAVILEEELGYPIPDEFTVDTTLREIAQVAAKVGAGT